MSKSSDVPRRGRRHAALLEEFPIQKPIPGSNGAKVSTNVYDYLSGCIQFLSNKFAVGNALLPIASLNDPVAIKANEVVQTIHDLTRFLPMVIAVAEEELKDIKKNGQMLLLNDVMKASYPAIFLLNQIIETRSLGVLFAGDDVNVGAHPILASIERFVTNATGSNEGQLAADVLKSAKNWPELIFNSEHFLRNHSEDDGVKAKVRAALASLKAEQVQVLARKEHDRAFYKPLFKAYSRIDQPKYQEWLQDNIEQLIAAARQELQENPETMQIHLSTQWKEARPRALVLLALLCSGDNVEQREHRAAREQWVVQQLTPRQRRYLEAANTLCKTNRAIPELVPGAREGFAIAETEHTRWVERSRIGAWSTTSFYKQLYKRAALPAEPTLDQRLHANATAAFEILIENFKKGDANSVTQAENLKKALLGELLPKNLDYRYVKEAISLNVQGNPYVRIDWDISTSHTHQQKYWINLIQAHCNDKEDMQGVWSYQYAEYWETLSNSYHNNATSMEKKAEALNLMILGRKIYVAQLELYEQYLRKGGVAPQPQAPARSRGQAPAPTTADDVKALIVREKLKLCALEALCSKSDTMAEAIAKRAAWGGVGLLPGLVLAGSGVGVAFAGGSQVFEAALEALQDVLKGSFHTLHDGLAAGNPILLVVVIGTALGLIGLVTGILGAAEAASHIKGHDKALRVFEDQVVKGWRGPALDVGILI